LLAGRGAANFFVERLDKPRQTIYLIGHKGGRKMIEFLTAVVILIVAVSL